VDETAARVHAKRDPIPLLEAGGAEVGVAGASGEVVRAEA
jgi:hypothetical protein